MPRFGALQDAVAWADYFLHARATDADALAAFGRRLEGDCAQAAGVMETVRVA